MLSIPFPEHVINEEDVGKIEIQKRRNIHEIRKTKLKFLRKEGLANLILKDILKARETRESSKLTASRTCVNSCKDNY